MQDTSKLKNEIIVFIQEQGPCLPINVARKVNLSPLFASAFLSELLSEKKIKTSHMKVGNSPLYLIQGQEPKLENFSDHIKSKEKEAFLLLKEKKFLKDKEQEPAIRVALRSIKDFAIPFEKENILFWRYFTVPESELNFKKESSEKKETNSEQERKIQEEKQTNQEKSETKKEDYEKDKKEIKKPKSKKKTSNKRNEKFFNIVKEYLTEKSIEITGIEGFSKNDLILKIKEKEKEKILVAYNKKRINETDIISAYKKAIEYNLPYTILSLGEPLKKLTNIIEAIQNLSSIEKIDK